MIFRELQNRLPTSAARRLVMITGARQTGKTTLARILYSTLRYVSLDDLEERARLRALPTRAWGRTVGDAVLDMQIMEEARNDRAHDALQQSVLRLQNDDLAAQLA